MIFAISLFALALALVFGLEQPIASPIAALALISISARLLMKNADGFWARVLKKSTISFAVMAAVLLAAAFAVSLLSQNFRHNSAAFWLPITAAIPLVILAAGFFVYLAKRGSKTPKIVAVCEFAVGFVLAGATTVAVLAAQTAIAMNTWKSRPLPTSPECLMQFKRLPAMCPEYDRRIAFKSGKTVGLSVDTCGQSDFDVYEVGGKILLKNKSFGDSFVVDAKNEKVFVLLDSESVAELKGGVVDGRDGGAESKTVAFYGKNGSSFNSEVLNGKEMLSVKIFRGTFSPAGFEAAKVSAKSEAEGTEFSAIPAVCLREIDKYRKANAQSTERKLVVGFFELEDGNIKNAQFFPFSPENNSDKINAVRISEDTLRVMCNFENFNINTTIWLPKSGKIQMVLGRMQLTGQSDTGRRDKIDKLAVLFSMQEANTAANAAEENEIKTKKK